MTPVALLLVGLVLGVHLGIYLGIRYAIEEAQPEIQEEHSRIDRQDEYWDSLQSMLAETKAWANDRDPADWWKRGESESDPA